MNQSDYRVGLKQCALFFLLVSMQSGCAGPAANSVIRPGDRVGVHFTCVGKNGEILVSTESGVARDPLLVKSPVFMARDAEDALELVAGRVETTPAPRDFEADVIQGISQLLPGMHGSESRTLELAPVSSRYGEVEGKLTLARVKRRDKEIRVNAEEFASHTGRVPQAGDRVLFEEEFPCQVREVADGVATLVFSGSVGSVIPTRLGPATVRDAGEEYEVVAESKSGDLVRLGPLVARVASVDADNVHLDFTKSYAGETLVCQVRTGEVLPALEPSAARAATESAEKEAVAPESVAKGSGIPSDGGSKAAPAASAAQPLVGESKARTAPVSLDNLLKAAAGDLVTLRFAVRFGDGTALAFADGAAPASGPVEILAGSHELFPGLGDAAVGMTPGEKKELSLAPEQAFGPRDPAAVSSFPVRQSVPLTTRISAEEYLKRFQGLPSVGREIPLGPYLKAKVSALGERDVEVTVTAQDGQRFEEPFGTIETHLGAQAVELVLQPRLGAAFAAGERQGKISSTDGVNFSVDFNHPLAGKSLLVDLELVSLNKNASPPPALSWVEDHDLGLLEAKKEGKPVFLMLYADWCGWCKKTMTGSIPDPRVQRLKDRFVWVKVNSDQETKFKKQYGQDGYPLMLVLNADGSVRRRIDGYRDAVALAVELKEAL